MISHLIKIYSLIIHLFLSLVVKELTLEAAIVKKGLNSHNNKTLNQGQNCLPSDV